MTVLLSHRKEYVIMYFRYSCVGLITDGRHKTFRKEDVTGMNSTTLLGCWKAGLNDIRTVSDRVIIVASSQSTR